MSQIGRQLHHGLFELFTVSPFHLHWLLWFSDHLSAGHLAFSSKPERCIGSSDGQDLVTRSMYLRPCISQESFDRKHAHVLKRYMVLITRVDTISYVTVTAAMRT